MMNSEGQNYFQQNHLQGLQEKSEIFLDANATNQISDFSSTTKIAQFSIIDVYLYEFLGYIAYKSGELVEVFRLEEEEFMAQMEAEHKKEIDRIKNRQINMRVISRQYLSSGSKELPEPIKPEFEMPVKTEAELDYVNLFKKYLSINSKTIHHTFCFKLMDRFFEIQFIDFQESLLKFSENFFKYKLEFDCVMFLVKATPEYYETKIFQNLEFMGKQFMHIQFGTRSIYWLPYFDFKSYDEKYNDKQATRIDSIIQELEDLTKILIETFDVGVDSVSTYGLCLRTDTKPAGKFHQEDQHVKRAAKLYKESKITFNRLDAEVGCHWLDLNEIFCQIQTNKTYDEQLKHKPLRFMVSESYIVGGLVGSYVIGECLSGTMVKNHEIVSPCGKLYSKINFIEENQELVDYGYPNKRVGVSLPNIKCKDIKRGCVFGEKDIGEHQVRFTQYAVGVFQLMKFDGKIFSGMKLFLINCKIRRRCKIVILKKIQFVNKNHIEGNSIIKGVDTDEAIGSDLTLIRIEPIEGEQLVFDDPAVFPSLSEIVLKDAAQDIAIGKLHKVFAINEYGYGQNRQGELPMQKVSDFEGMGTSSQVIQRPTN